MTMSGNGLDSDLIRNWSLDIWWDFSNNLLLQAADGLSINNLFGRHQLRAWRTHVSFDTKSRRCG
jgi:hypothetical protein